MLDNNLLSQLTNNAKPYPSITKCPIKREHFDYTSWQRDLWNDKTIDEVFSLAAEREQARVD
ncbi:MAG: hypothetical protein FWG87_02105 [Defluviitaleaceae bacterium]|nr:hypothetical protein [Defluviitaleaceae bacterium]